VARDYVGATKRIDLATASALGSRFVIQPKKDGIYVRVYLDGRGRIAKVFMRNGVEVPAHITSHLRGALAGNPHAELVGELEAMTEQAERRAKVGPRKIWLFDALHSGVRSMLHSPYSERRDALWRMTSAVQCAAPDDDHRPKPWRRYRDVSGPGWQLCPVMPQVASADARRVWEEWVVGPDDGEEGLVAVALDAPVGRRASKMKVKTTESIDAVAVSVSRTVVTCEWRGMPFNVSRGRHHVELGEMVEVACDGFYDRFAVPRFARIVRIRRDLVLQ
jgi:ATP-dependent DNA ligase